jgi:DNA-binding NarL/FixJ family response regulator
MRVVVADDAVLLREGLSRLLEEAGFEVAGLAADADALVELVERTQPDVAIIDIRMPPTHTDEGLRAAKVIREKWPKVGLLVLSQHVNARYALELLSGGTDGVGYLLKERVSDLDELSSSVNRVGQGATDKSTPGWGSCCKDPLCADNARHKPHHRRPRDRQ